MSAHSSHDATAGDLTETVPADLVSAVRLTNQLRQWISRALPVSDERCSDIVLAAYEALANCADHSYRDHAQQAP